MKKQLSKIDNILVTNYYSGNKTGGDVHFKFISEIWKEKGIKILDFYKNDMNDNPLFNRFALFPIFSIQLIITKIKNLLPLKDNPDIILCSSPYLPDLLASLFIYFKYDKHVIVYFHHLPPKLYWHPFKRGLLSSLFNSFYMNSALIICKILNFSIMLDQPHAYKLGSISVMKGENAIVDNFKTNYINVTNDFRFDIGFLARFQQSKGIFDFISSISKVIAKFPDLKIFIAGYAPDLKLLNNVKNKINKLGIESNITLFTDIDNLTKIKLLKNLKIYVFPSYVEGWAISVMEAAYAGVPIVAYELPAYSYLDGNYFPVKAGSIKKLSEKIEYVLLNYELAKKVASTAKEKVTKYNYNKIAEDQLHFFSHVL